jgi:hypothetical protein
MDKDLGIFINKTCIDITDCKVSSIDCVDNYIVLGDEKGNIYSYETKQNGEMTLNHCQAVIKGKPIDQVKCLPHLNLAYVLANGVLHGYTIPKLDMKFKFENKNVGTVHKVVLNEAPGCQNQLLIVNKKRMVRFFEYNNEISKLIEMKLEELHVYELPEIIEWYGNWLGYVNKKKFFLVNIIDSVTLPLDPEVTNAKALDGSWLIYTNSIGIFMEQNAPKQQNPITFSTKPIIALGTYKNYIIALHDSLVAVYDSNDSSQVQEIQLEHGSVGKFLVMGQKRIFYLVSSFSDKKDINAYQICELKELAYEKQIFKLLNESKIEEALNILNNNISSSNEEKPKKLEQFFIDCSWACLKKCEFEKGYQYGKLANFNPIEFLYLFKTILNVKIFHEELKTATLPSIEALTNQREDSINDALTMLSNLLQDKRNLILSSYDMQKDGLKNMYFITSENSLINLNKYEFRVSMILEILNTYILKVYARKKESIKKIADIIEHDNFSCNWEDLESFLFAENSDTSKITLAYLNERKMKYEDALKTWQEYGNKVESNAAQSREACERTKILLKKANDKRLFHDYIQWMLVRYPNAAFELFLSTEIVPVEYFFSTIIGSVEKNNSNLNLKEKFLEFYIASGNASERYHSILAETYIEKLFKLKKNDSPYDPAHVDGNLKAYLEKFDKLLRTSNYYNKGHILDRIKNSWLMDQEIYLFGKLDLHKDALLKLISVGVDNKDFEKVESYCSEMVNSKPEIIADLFKLLSESYNNNMNQLKTARNETDRKNYENLSEIYKNEMLNCLKKFADNNLLDPFVVLNQIPVDWLLSDEALYNYLTKILKDYTHMSNKYKIARNLSETAVLYKEKELIESKDKSITIGNDSYCELCRKKVNTAMFSVYPNMKVYHPKCAANPNVCPVTRTDFTKNKLF